MNGFDEKNLPSSLFGIDFCLRLGEQGYRIVWTPFAELVQNKNSLIENSLLETLPETSYFKEKWKENIAADPFYNINLTLKSEDFSVAVPPRF